MLNNNWFKSYVIQILPLIAFVIYMWGFAYYVAFYFEFGVSIINYISLNEVFVSALVPIVGASALILSGVSFQLVFGRFNSGMFSQISWRNKKRIVSWKKSIENLNNRMEELSYKSYQHKLRSISFLFIAFIYIITILYCTSASSVLKFWIILVLLSTMAFLMREYLLTLRKVSPTILRKAVTRDLCAAILTVLIASFCIGNNNAVVLKNVSDGREYRISMMNGESIGNADMTYVGETYSVVFLYDMNSKNTVVINKEAIQSISVNSKESLRKVSDNLFQKQK